jgi:F-type H+-transporting ATPase subunit delta
MASVEKTYADAFFSLLESENPDKSAGRPAFDTALTQLKCVGETIAETPDLLKLMNTPTISDDEKLGLIDSVYGEKVTDYVRNFLRLLAVKKRMSYFPQILREFRRRYNEHFDIAEITVTSAMPISQDLRGKIAAKMAQITGKPAENVLVTEKVDKTLLGGVVVDYGNMRLDGSVKTRLNELAKDIAGTIA